MQFQIKVFDDLGRPEYLYSSEEVWWKVIDMQTGEVVSVATLKVATTTITQVTEHVKQLCKDPDRFRKPVTPHEKKH